MYPLSRCYCCPLPPSRPVALAQTTPLCPGSAVGSLLIKLTQVKVRMVFDMKCMKLTGKHIAPHFYHTESECHPPPPPSPSNPPLCATYIRSYNQLAIFLLTPTLSSSLSLLPVVICDMSSSSKCCFYQPPPPVSFLLLRHCGLRLFGIVEARFMKRIYTISICDTRTSRLASIYTLCRYSRNATPPSAPFPTPFVSISKCILYTRQDTRATFLF